MVSVPPVAVVLKYVQETWPFASVTHAGLGPGAQVGVVVLLAPALGPEITANLTETPTCGFPSWSSTVAVTVWVVPGMAGFVSLEGVSVIPTGISTWAPPMAAGCP